MKRALVSVSNKENLIPFVKELINLEYQIISTGGTKKLIENAGLPVIGISEVTGFPEIMDGRVKTLHPKVHGGLLSLRDNPKHLAEMSANHIEFIDMVVVNLYPFKQTIEKEGGPSGLEKQKHESVSGKQKRAQDRCPSGKQQRRQRATLLVYSRNNLQMYDCWPCNEHFHATLPYIGCKPKLSQNHETHAYLPSQ